MLRNKYNQLHHVVCVYSSYIFDSEHKYAIPLSVNNLQVCANGASFSSEYKPIAKCFIFLLSPKTKKPKFSIPKSVHKM